MAKAKKAKKTAKKATKKTAKKTSKRKVVSKSKKPSMSIVARAAARRVASMRK